jgi:hypothetical protein
MAERTCRHVFTGEFRDRKCENAFDCRLCTTHAKLVAKHPPAPADPNAADVLGLKIPADRYYHRGHTWARQEEDGTVRVGLDELGTRLVGRPDGIELLAPGSRLEVNGPAWRMRKRDAEVRVLSPVAGEVIETGGPATGWFLKVKPEGGVLDTRHLLWGAEVRPWMMRELERLQLALGSPHTGAALADGGVPRRGYRRRLSGCRLGCRVWRDVSGTLTGYRGTSYFLIFS